jgi:hypothetical protein
MGNRTKANKPAASPKTSHQNKRLQEHHDTYKSLIFSNAANKQLTVL